MSMGLPLHPLLASCLDDVARLEAGHAHRVAGVHDEAGALAELLSDDRCWSGPGAHKLHYRPQHFLYFLPLPQGQGSFLPGSRADRGVLALGASCCSASSSASGLIASGSSSSSASSR